MIFEVWWFKGPKPEYRSAGPSPYGEHNKVKECKDWGYCPDEHVCYIEASSLDEAMAMATSRHPTWTPLPVRVPKKEEKATP